MNFGIDVSKWQGNFNFTQAKAEGVEFAILKAGGSDSGRYKDKKFNDFYAECKRLKIPVGAYYFGLDMTVASAIKSAEHFASLLAGKTFEFPVYYDVEGKMLNINKTNLTNIVKAFCDTMVKYGYKVGIYTSQSVFNTKVNDKLLNYSHWVARWSKTEPKKLNSGAAIDIWQFGGSQNFIRSNKIAGVVCDQDYNYMNTISNAGLNIPIKPNTKPITYSKYGIGVVECPGGISGSIDFDLLDYSVVYDFNYYKNNYPDLTKNGLVTKQQFINHFITIGMVKEARQGCKEFNPVAYKKFNPDLAELFGNDWKWYYAHYICAGKREGRRCK